MDNIGSVSLIQKMQEMASAAGNGIQTEKTNTSEGSEFTDIFNKAINSVNELQKESSTLKSGFELGDPDINLTQVMIASQKAEISFQALLQVRNKLLSAYQEIMRIQI